MKILIVEDDVPTGALLSQLLLAHHYVVDVATDGQMGYELATIWEYDLIVLDWLIPGLDGVSVCRSLRERGYSKPILLLTAKINNQDVIAGLDAGADDYVTKPFQPETLLARIRALLRRGSEGAPVPLLRWGELCFDPVSAAVTYAAQPLPLTPKEYTLLELFLRNPKRVFSRSAIIDRLWSVDASPSESAVTNLTKDLRQKLKKAGLEDEIIETVYGLGYRLKPYPEVAPEPPLTAVGATVSAIEPVPSAPAPTAPTSGPPGAASLQQTLERLRPTLQQQVATLEQTIVQLRTHPADWVLRQRAEALAHKLAGSLGTFGYGTGSQLARVMEHALARWSKTGSGEAAQPLPAVDQAHLQQLMADLQASLQQVPQLWEPLPSLPDSPAISMRAPRVLLVDDDPTLTHTLMAEAPHWGLQLKVIADPTQLTVDWSEPPADAVVMELNFRTSAVDGFELLQRLRQVYPALPVIVLTHRDSLEDRITVSRLGGKVYLRKPLPQQDILQTIVQILAQPQSADGSILVVDDDPVSLAIIRKVLQPWGLQVTSLQDSTRFWEVLTATQPHLLILDIEMPTFSGIELCRVVRQDPSWRNLRILVVTSHTQRSAIEDAFAAGADEYLTKPIVAADLVTRTIHWIERLSWQDG